MALRLVFNPFTAKLDWVDIADTSNFALRTPQNVPILFEVITNTQVCYANPIVTTGNGVVLTTGTGVLTYVR